jgi:hypothetical protein
MGDEDMETCVQTVGEKTRGSHKTRHYAGLVTALATYSHNDPLFVEFDPTLQLGREETLAMGVRRVALEQFELAAQGFFDGEEHFLRSVHEARKAGKRIRALLRLVRYELPGKIFTYEDRVVRDTGRMLAPTRAAVSVVNAAEVIESSSACTGSSWPRAPSASWWRGCDADAS